GHPPAGAEPVRPRLRDRASATRAEDGDDRAVWTGGDPTSPGAALASGRGPGATRPAPGEREREIIRCLAARPATAGWASSEPARPALLSPARPWPVDTTSQYRGLGLPSAYS